MTDNNIREIRIDPIVPTRSVLISTARGKRPRHEEEPHEKDVREYADNCPFCKGNEHLTPPAIFQRPLEGDWKIRIIENLYPILDDDPLHLEQRLGIQRSIEGYGHHEVIIDHTNHGISLHQFDERHLASLFMVYRDRMKELYAIDPKIKYILVFKNYGKAAGGSIAHTHSQLVAMPIVPHNVQDEVDCSRAFYQDTGTCIFCTLVDEALSLKTITYSKEAGKVRQAYKTGKYVVEKGEYFIAIKPFASRYEWEIHILPLSHQSDFLDIKMKELQDLALVLRRVIARLQAVVGDLQYNYFLHTLPKYVSIDNSNNFHWHLEICPRTAIPSGFELGSGLFVNSVSPEEAASTLRAVVVDDETCIVDE